MNIQYLETSGKRKGMIRRNFSNDEFQEIKKITPWILNKSRSSLRERVHCILNNITKIPICHMCGKDCNFLASGKYSITCSKECSENEERTNKMKNTKIERYGSESFVNPEKAKQTCIEKYGVEHTSILKENRMKAKQTCLERYGDENFNNIDKIKETCIEKYGVDNVSKSKEIKDKISINLSNNYNKRRVDDDYHGFLYILKFNSINLIKIGITHDFSSRAKSLQYDFGEYELIKLIGTDKCFELENYYHSLLRDYRVCLKEGMGRTEFFKIECLEPLMEAL